MAVMQLELFVFFTDDGFGFIEKRQDSLEIENFGEVKLAKGIIKNGYIKEPEILLEKMKGVFKSFKIKAKTITMVINEQNCVLREIIINKKDLGTTTIADYFHEQLGKTIHFPFKVPAVDFHIRDETTEVYHVIAFVADQNLLHDYSDIFEALRLKEISFDLPHLCLFRLFYQDNEFEEEKKEVETASRLGRRVRKVKQDDDDGSMEGLMMVTLYDSVISLVVFDRKFPVFSLIEELEGLEVIYDVIEAYVARIANYYRFNIHNGRKAIKHIEMVNLSTKTQDSNLYEQLTVRLEDMKLNIFDLGLKSSYFKQILPRGCYMPLAASLKKE